MRNWFVTALFWLLFSALQGCGMTVYAPTEVSDPVSIFIADHGVHSSLLLPREDGTIAQFAYSQWHWAALDQDDWYRSPFALVIPNAGTLGWRDFQGPCEFDCVCDRLHKLGRHPPIEAVYEIAVERAMVNKALETLDHRWKSQSEGSVFNERRGMTFVKDDSWYSIGHTCNEEVAAWLELTGCRVTGMAKTASIRVVGGRHCWEGPQESGGSETAGADMSEY